MTVRGKRWLRLGLWLLTVAWMGLIFYFSLENADSSDATSGRVIRWLLTHFDRSFLQLPPEEQLLRIGDLSFVVRKLAHFILFAGMGFLAFAAFSVDLPPRRAFPAALGLGAGRASLDEVPPSFVPGRSCEFRDVCIDTAGVLLGASFLLLVLLLVRRKKHSEQKI